MLNKYYELHKTVEHRKNEYYWPIMYEKYPMRNFHHVNKSSFVGDIDEIFSSMKNENIFNEIMYRMKFLYDWSIWLQEVQENNLVLIRQELADNKH